MIGINIIAGEKSRLDEDGDIIPNGDRQANELIFAAMYYALPHAVAVDGGVISPGSLFTSTGWPAEFAKRGHIGRLQQLAVAGALIAAEIDQLMDSAMEGLKNGKK